MSEVNHARINALEDASRILARARMECSSNPAAHSFANRAERHIARQIEEEVGSTFFAPDEEGGAL